MELFAMAFSVPGGQVLGQVYAFVIAIAAPRFKWLAKLFYICSCGVLVGLVIEYLLLFLLGAI
jgi:hypothetical protein